MFHFSSTAGGESLAEMAKDVQLLSFSNSQDYRDLDDYTDKPFCVVLRSSSYTWAKFLIVKCNSVDVSNPRFKLNLTFYH